MYAGDFADNVGTDEKSGNCAGVGGYCNSDFLFKRAGIGSFLFPAVCAVADY